MYGCLQAQAGQLSYPSPPFATDDKLTKVRNSCKGMIPRPVTIALSSFKTGKPSYVGFRFSSHTGMCRFVHARGGSPMIPSACAFGSLEFASRKVQELSF